MAPLPEDLDALTSRALRTRPELARLSAQVNALQCQAEGTRAANRPQLGVLGGYTYVENEHLAPEGYGSVTVAMEWVPYDGGMARSRGNSLQQQASAVSRLRADAATLIQLEVRKAWLDEQEARARIDITGKAIEQAEENLRVAQSRYRQGEGTNTEVLDAETLRTLTYNNYHNAVYDAILGVLRLQRAVGTL
ncbi:MAG: TolC family protein [Patescibacteria group bacterium]|nr:TolC family protein [Patescibacteria group bacterium]